MLEIEPGASHEEIRHAYRDQTKVWHADRFSNDIRLQKKAEDKLKQINLAYQRLCRGGPYEPPLLNPPTERYPSGWIAVFALRRALTKSVIAITKPFRLWMAKTVSVGNKVFQWCLRQRRSLAIATTAFLLRFALGVWFLPRKSEIWAKINNLRQKIIEKAHGNSASGRSQAIAYCNNSALSKEAANCIFGEDGSPSSPSSVYCHELKPANSSPIRRCFSLENGRRHNSFLGR